jgi:hypothetical protein
MLTAQSNVMRAMILEQYGCDRFRIDGLKKDTKSRANQYDFCIKECDTFCAERG